MQDTVAEVDGLRTSVASECGVVTATVDGLGTLVGLTITDAVAEMDARTVAALTVSTVHQAVRRVTTERERLLQALRASLRQM